MDEIITINDHEITPLVYNGQRVLTFKMIDKIHSKPDGSARKRFADNRERFIENEDYFIGKPTEIYEESVLRTYQNKDIKIALLTESGYLLLVKSFTDDFAWKTQRLLIKCYFKIKSDKSQLPQTFPEALRLLADQVERNQVLESKIEEDRPRVEFTKNIEISEDSIEVGDLAKILCKNGIEIGRNRLFKILKDKNGELRLLIDTDKPLQSAIDNKWLEVEEYTFTTKKGEERIAKKVMVTGKGQLYIERKLRKILEQG